MKNEVNNEVLENITGGKNQFFDDFLMIVKQNIQHAEKDRMLDCRRLLIDQLVTEFHKGNFNMKELILMRDTIINGTEVTTKA